MVRKVHVLVVTNMYPSPASPARGRFVYDQVNALRDLPGVELDLYAFAGGGASAYVRAARQLRRRFNGRRFDVVHAHFGLTAWPALAVRARAHAVTLHGTDLEHPRSRALTLAGLPLIDLVATASSPLAERVPSWALRGRGVAVLPCGVDMCRFEHSDRQAARRALELEPDRRYLLFPADPGRPEKRYDRAAQLAQSVGATLLVLGAVDPDRVPLYVNAADAVVVPSEREGFGLGMLEALACDVPVLATPVGIAPEALSGVDGTYCGAFELQRWRSALSEILAAGDPRIAGRSAAERYSAVAMAARVADAWRRLLAVS
jgi:glycosyltransferase involved in cell wall biosynthesis